jgi:uncharacterized protein DUF4268
MATPEDDIHRMPDATESKHESSTTAFQELSGNLEYARDLVRGGRHLERLQVRAFDVADLYRAAWVQAVSALDHWVHRELYDRALGLAVNVGAPRPPRFFALQIPMRLFEDVHHHSKTLPQAFAAHLRAHFGYQSFQAPDKIKQALAHVSDVSLWPSVATYLADNGDGELTSQDSVVACLKDIVHRRNKIAHEADRDPDDGTKRLSISADEVSRTVDQIEQIASAIAAVLGSPAATSGQPVTDGKQTQVPATVGLTAKQELYRQFWAEFKPIVERHGWTKAAPPAANGWNMPGGVTGTTWAQSFSMFGCRAELYFEHTDPATNLARWRILFERRDEITAHFGGELIFDDLPNNKGCRIETRLFGVTVDDRPEWPHIRHWMEDSQTRLRAAVDAVGGVPNIVAPLGSTEV